MDFQQWFDKVKGGYFFTALEKKVLEVLYYDASPDLGINEAHCGVQDIAEELGLTKHNVKGVVGILSAKGLIRSEERKEIIGHFKSSGRPKYDRYRVFVMAGFDN